MGNRALIVVHDAAKKEYSPVLYLHYGGSQSDGDKRTDAQRYVAALATLMNDRRNDVPYAFARLVGIAHCDMPGNLSVGVMPLPSDFQDSREYLRSMSHGDAGVYLVNADTFKTRNVR